MLLRPSCIYVGLGVSWAFLGEQSGGFVPLFGCFWYDYVCAPEGIKRCDLFFFPHNKHVSSKSFNFLKRRQKRLPWLKGERRTTATTTLNRLRNSDSCLATNQPVSASGNCVLLWSPGYMWRTLGCRDVNTIWRILQCPSLVTWFPCAGKNKWNCFIWLENGLFQAAAPQGKFQCFKIETIEFKYTTWIISLTYICRAYIWEMSLITNSMTFESVTISLETC